MIARIYKQTHPGSRLQLVRKGELFAVHQCSDCKGTGLYEIEPGHSFPCNACKTSGIVWVNLY